MSIQFGDCIFDTASRQLSRDGEPVAVEPRALDLLMYFIANKDRAIGKDELQDKVWGTIVTDAALSRAVMKLRKAVEPDPGQPAFILTVPRFGYRFTGSAPQADKGAGGNVSKRSIAVLPLLNMSDDSDMEFFSDGVAEEILNALAHISQLRVASRTSSFSFRGSELDLKTIARELDVGTIMEGSVRRAGDKVRITIQLIDADTDGHLWSETYDRSLNDIFAVQEDIARKVASALTSGKTGMEFAFSSSTMNPKAYDFFLRGRQFYFQWDRGALDHAAAMFDHALSIDANYARAWAGKANCMSSKFQWQDASEENLRFAIECSKKALALAPELAESHAAYGFALTLGKDFVQAASEFEAAIELDPMLYDAWYLFARARFAEGKPDAAAKLFVQAARISPDEYQAASLAATAFLQAGDEQAGIDQGWDGIRRARRHLRLNPDDTRAMVLTGSNYIQVGDKENGLEFLERALAIAPNDINVLHNVGCGLAAAGEIDRALDVFEKRFSMGSAYKDWLDNDPDIDPLRGHPRFKAMVRTS